VTFACTPLFHLLYICSSKTKVFWTRMSFLNHTLCSSATAFSLITLRIMYLIVTLIIIDTQHNNTRHCMSLGWLSYIMMSVVMLDVLTLSAVVPYAG